MSVIVFGSLNMDLVSRTPRLPIAGETIIGSDFYTTPGGKGANQAVAVARLGIPTKMIGRVGGDPFGQELLAALHLVGVDTDGVKIDRATHSGVAVITVADTGENQIIGVLGANNGLDETDVARLAQHLPHAKALMLQLEIPLTAMRQAAIAAHQAGIPVLLDPAPVPTSSPSLFPIPYSLFPSHHPQLPGAPLKGPTISLVIQPP